MKTRRIVLFVVLMCFVATTGFANTGDTTTKVLDLAIASNPYLKGIDWIPTFTVYNGTLFVVNKDKLVQIDLKTGAITLNKPVTDFLKKLPKDKNFVSQITVTENEYYLSVFNELYAITVAGKSTKIYEMDRFFEGVSVLNDRLVVASLDKVELINKNGKRLNTLSFEGTNDFRKGENGIYYETTFEDSVIEFQSDGATALSLNRYPGLSELKKMKEPYVSYVSDKYFIAFDYTKRNAIYVIKKGLNKNEVYKTIAVKGANLTPTHAQVMDEEGTPNLEIGYSDNVYYILSIIKGKLKVLTFTL